MGTIAFLPWVYLRYEIVIDGIIFKPVKISTCDIQDDILQKIIGVLKPYSISPIYESSISEFTLVYFKDLGIIHELDEEKMNKLFLVTEFLRFTALGQREYFAYGSYYNASNFQLIIQKFTSAEFGVTTLHRRRDGSLTTYTPGNQFKQFAPSNLSKLESFKIDIEVMKSLYQAYSSDLDEWEKIYDSLLAFNLASTDGELRENSELLLLCGALEQLLDCKSNYMDFSEKFADLFTDFPLIVVKNRDKILGPKISRFNTDLRRAWAADLYQLRGGLAHGAQSIRFYNSSWNLHEHLILSSFILPLIIKLKLAEMKLYALTENDERSIFSIDYLLAKQNIMRCNLRGDPTTSNWSVQLSVARWEFLIRGL